jgi:hypothetical protein
MFRNIEKKKKNFLLTTPPFLKKKKKKKKKSQTETSLKKSYINLVRQALCLFFFAYYKLFSFKK